MKTTYSNLNLYIHDKKEKPVGCGYYYVVTAGSMPHTAFRTSKALKHWLKITGLKIGNRKSWLKNSVALNGTYSVNCEMLNNIEFFCKYSHLEPTPNLCNSDYSIGFIEILNNEKIIHFQNPNTDRFILDYKITSSRIDNGDSKMYY